jgi:putative membrane-bound dehydrogenase-like protein
MASATRRAGTTSPTASTGGPDGWLYFGHGRTSPSDVGRPGTPAEKRIHCDGGVVRIHPTRRVFENFSDGTTNPWGVAFDDFGQCFVSNCVNPHLFPMIQGGHYEPWRNRSSSHYAYERLATCTPPGGPWQEARGESAKVLEMGGGHAHCGTLIYLGGLFPAEYRRSVFMCNIHGRRINRDILRRKGSGYVVGHGADFMLAGDPWFMGVTLRAGTNGSIFVSDWSDTGDCHIYHVRRGGLPPFNVYVIVLIAPTESTAWKVIVKPAAGMVAMEPLRRPVAGLNVSPGGNAPMTLSVLLPVPPVVEMVCE